MLKQVGYKANAEPHFFVTPEKQQDYIRQHVELILEVGHKHGIQRLEAFRLMGYQQPWHRFWVIEFPTLEGAEQWIEAEMAPPYGSDGYWEYYLARPWDPDYFSSLYFLNNGYPAFMHSLL